MAILKYFSTEMKIFFTFGTKNKCNLFNFENYVETGHDRGFTEDARGNSEWL